MRTAEKWAVNIYDGHHFGPESWIEIKAGDAISLFKSIQADAIRGAIDEIRNAAGCDCNIKQLEPAIKLAKELEL